MQKRVTHEDYQRAENLLVTNTSKYVLNSRVKANWLGQTDRFWYKRELRKEEGRGKQFILVDAYQNSCEPAFDHERVAKAISDLAGKSYDPDNLPFEHFEYSNDGQAITFDIQEERWNCDLTTYFCSRSEKAEENSEKPHSLEAAGELPSPDGKWTAFIESHNLYARSLETGEVISLTHDGQPYFDYATQPENSTSAVTERLLGLKQVPTAIWSPDSKKLLTYRLDQRLVRDLHLVQSVPPGDDVRPLLHSYRYPLPGDEHVPLMELIVIDLETRSQVPLDKPRQVPFIYTSLAQGLRTADWSKKGDKVYYVRLDRDFQTAQFVIADPITGEHKILLEEKSSTFLDFDISHLDVRKSSGGLKNPNIRLLDSGESFIWQSSRDGFPHFYLYDAGTGSFKNPLTSGEWAVRTIEKVDEERGWLYFTAGGREEGRDPYFLHLYRVRLDGTGLTLLTPEDATHMVDFSPNHEYFLDTFSRVDLPPVTVLRAVDGRLIRELEQADITLLLAQGYQLPERFTVKAQDGETDLYGVLVRPADCAPNGKFPVIDYFYAGPQVVNTPKAFCFEANRGVVDLLGGAQPLAQLGFATVIMDGMGTPARSKAFHDVSHGNLQGAAGLCDHVAGMKQLAEMYPFIDLDRVGIWGISGGGYGSTRAILTYPDFYKVAVSVCGNHDQRVYVYAWGERYQGMYTPDLYRDQDNTTLVSNLKGNLLLVHGDMDDNVHPAHTMRMVDALIKANKDFDLLILPNVNHMALTPYFTRKKWDYFVKHLLGAEPPKEYCFQK